MGCVILASVVSWARRSKWITQFQDLCWCWHLPFAACVQSSLAGWEAAHLSNKCCLILVFQLKPAWYHVQNGQCQAVYGSTNKRINMWGLDSPGLTEWVKAMSSSHALSADCPRADLGVGWTYYSTSNSFTFHRHWSTGISCWCTNSPSKCAASDWIISWAHTAWPSPQPEEWLSHWPCKMVWFRCLAAASPFHAIQSHQRRWTGIPAVSSDHWVEHLWFFRLDTNVHSQDFTSVCFLGLLFLALCAKFLFERLKHMAPVLVSCLHQD